MDVFYLHLKTNVYHDLKIGYSGMTDCSKEEAPSYRIMVASFDGRVSSWVKLTRLHDIHEALFVMLNGFSYVISIMPIRAFPSSKTKLHVPKLQH